MSFYLCLSNISLCLDSGYASLARILQNGYSTVFFAFYQAEHNCICLIAGGIHFNDLNEVVSARLSNVKLLFHLSVVVFSKRYIFHVKYSFS